MRTIRICPEEFLPCQLSAIHCFLGENGGRQDKSYGLGRVGFPQEEPAVAAQAVSIESSSPSVAKFGYPIAT